MKFTKFPSIGRPSRDKVISEILDEIDYEQLIEDLCLYETVDVRPQSFPSPIDWSYWL